MRILHFPHNVGGHPAGLAKAERQMGHSSICVTLHPNGQGVNGDVILNPFGARMRWLDEIIKWFFLAYALLAYDVVHFNFGDKFFTFQATRAVPGEGHLKAALRHLYYRYSQVAGELDLWLLKKFKKKIFVTFQGDDVRVGEFCRKNFPVHFYPFVQADYYTAETDQRKKALIQLWDKYADEIFYLNPDLGWILPERSQFFPYGHVDFEKITPNGIAAGGLRVVHAPTHRGVKGTDFLLRAVQSLRSQGVAIEMQMVESLPFEDALKIYRTADIVVDQLLAGWYGGFAVEAMALGKPVISYIREGDLKLIPKDMRKDLPVVCASPADIEEKLLQLLESKEERDRLARRGRDFAVKWHSPGPHMRVVLENYGK